MTIPEADAVSTLLRYLAPGSTVPVEDAADAAAYLTGKVHSALLAGPDPDQVREWVEKHAEQVRVQRDDVERAQAKISEYENTTTWFTTCHGCAGHLDREYAADHRAAKAEAEVERLRAEVADLQGQNALTEYHFTNYVDDAIEQRSALIALHEYDELIFGGFFCLHCTPDDCDDPDDNVYWPCPSLRAVGVTDEEGVALITARRAENAARHASTQEADRG